MRKTGVKISKHPENLLKYEYDVDNLLLNMNCMETCTVKNIVQKMQLAEQELHADDSMAKVKAQT